MRVRWSAAIISVATLLGCTTNPHQKNGLEPAAPFLFTRDHTPTPCERQTGVYLTGRSSNRPAHNLQRADLITFSRAEVPALSMRLGPSISEISGGDSDNYSVQLCAEAGAASESDAKGLLEEIKMTRDDKLISLSMPPFVQERPSNAYLQVQAPRDAPIAIDGSYAAMRLIGINGAVHLSTTHARVTLLDTTGSVDAKAAEFGVIDFSGDRGKVRLESAWEINLNFTGQKFDGSLDAKAAQPVRVLLPKGFASGFEAIVRHKTDFACRADICDRVSSHKRDGKFVFTFGSGDPALHFISQEGPVVIDNASSLASN